jgi:hypothetical protein
MHHGSCQCRAITFTVQGDLPPPNACHCSICRKQSGHFFASTEVKKTDLELKGAENLTWHQSSPKVRRGFCKICGASLFFDPPHRDWIAIAMGAFDGPTQTRLHLHIFVADKGDYYDISDGLPQNPQ